MIKASELRQGNLFEIEGIGIYPLVDFSCDFTGNVSQVTFLRSRNFHRARVPSETIETIICGLWQVKSIPLSEEWLSRAGFEGYAIWKKGYFELEYGHFSKCFQFRVGEWVNDILYVHQLQNLYYCLTGQELEVKL